MATLFSDHFTVDGVSTSPRSDPTQRTRGISHQRARKSVARISDSPDVTAGGDECRMLTLKSSDRIIAVYWTSTLAGTGTVSIGYAETGFTNDGPVVDDNAHGSAIDGSGQVRIDVFGNGLLEDPDRGKPLWELLEETTGGGGLYTEDPKLFFDLILTWAGSPSGTGEYAVEVEYVAGD